MGRGIESAAAARVVSANVFKPAPMNAELALSEGTTGQWSGRTSVRRGTINHAPLRVGVTTPANAPASSSLDAGALGSASAPQPSTQPQEVKVKPKAAGLKIGAASTLPNHRPASQARPGIRPQLQGG